jgi:4-diphosphocytidyl-2-C-methyl-D-erythritol kinase
VANVDVFDLISLSKRNNVFSSVKMHGMDSESIPPENNNALIAAEAFSKTFGTNGADITIYKNIPIGAGLGGSSADISGVLNGMAKLYEVEDREALAEIADTLGSDARYMLSGGFMRMQGRGTHLSSVEIPVQIPMLLFCPNASISAGACYKEYDKTLEKKGFSTGEITEKCIRAFENGDINEGGRYLTNDLYTPASAISPQIRQAFCDAASFAPSGVVMTGSGSAVLAIFESKELCEWAKSRYQGECKTFVVKTVDCADKADK